MTFWRFLYNIGVYRTAGPWRCCYFTDLWSYVKPCCVMSAALFWCAYTTRGTSEYLPITRFWFAAELSQCLDKMADVNSDDLIKNALFMPRLAICSRDLHWHWINWTVLCDTMEVSMLRLAWLTITQHVFQPALTGRLELISGKIVSCEPGTKAIAVSRFCEKLSPANWVHGVTTILRMYHALGRQKWGPTCDCDISNSAIYTNAIYREYIVWRCTGNIATRSSSIQE